MRRNYSIIPSMIRSASGIIWSYDNPYDIFYFNENKSLFISSKLCNQTSFCLWYTSPIWSFNDSLSTKFAFMGELNKWTFISQQRFSFLKFNSENTQMTIIAKGIRNELIQILIYHSKFQSIIHLHCLISNENLQVQIIINSTNVYCS